MDAWRKAGPVTLWTRGNERMLRAQQRSEYADTFVPVPLKDKKIRTSLIRRAICIGARRQQTHVGEDRKTARRLSFGTFRELFHSGKKESVRDAEHCHERMHKNRKH